MDMRALVGRNFARIRREKGLTQEQVEARSGFSQQYLSGLERGKRNLACCRFRGHEDKIVTKETEIGHGETEVHEGVQV